MTATQTIDFITTPLDLNEALRKATGNRLTVTIPVSLDDIINSNGMDEFNDLIEEKISDGWIMEDINYHPTGALENGEILIEVTCNIYEIE